MQKQLSLILLMCNCLMLKAQTDTTRTQWSLMTGTDFSTNASMNGRVNETRSQPSFSGYVSLFAGQHFDATINGFQIWNSDSTFEKATQEFDINIGYSLPVTKWLDARASYTHYIYSKNAQSIMSGFDDAFDATLSSKIKWWWTDLSTSYAMGDYNEFSLSLSTGATIDFDFKDGSTLSLQPGIDLMMSNLDYYNLNLIKKYWFLYNYGERYPDNTVNELYTQISSPTTLYLYRLKNFFNRRPKLYKSLGELPEEVMISSIFKPETNFTFSSAGISLPISYTRGNWEINAAASFYTPLNLPDYADSEWVSYYSLGLSYTIDL